MSGDEGDAGVDLVQYTVRWEAVGDAGMARAFHALLDLHGESLDVALVDAVTEERELPEAAALALEDLEALGEEQALARGPRPQRRFGPSLADDPRLAVELKLHDADHLRLLKDFGLFSTATVVFLADDDEPEIEISDLGKSFTFFGDKELVYHLCTNADIPRKACHRVR